MSASDFMPTGEAAPSSGVGGMTAGPSWQEQDGVLRDMWMQNKTPQEISDALGRSIPAIMTRAARLGLPRRAAPGRKPGRRMLDSTGITSPVQRNVARAMPKESAPIAAQTSLRVCLMCLTQFESVGRHNRICSSCKGSSEYESASSLPELHIPVS